MKNYISVDIETDGVVAGRNNMLSLGAAAIDMDCGQITSSFQVNIETIGDLHPDPDTMRWWQQFPEAFVSARMNAVGPKLAIYGFVNWIEHVMGTRSLIFGWNPVMDLGMIKYYVHRFHPAGADLVTHGVFGKRAMGLDMKTLAATVLGRPYSEMKMSTVPNSLRLDESGELMKPHSHNAQEDAIEQALIFYNLVRRSGVDL